MNEVKSRRQRSEFVTAIGHLLADRGLRHWQGNAVAHPSAPVNRICCLNAHDVLQDLCVTAFDPGKVREKVDLARLKLNWGYDFPARIQELRQTCPVGLKLELTCRVVDLPSLAHNIAALMLGEASEQRDYLWDERAAEGLLPDTREQFQRRGFLRSPVQPGLRALPAPGAKRALRGVP